MTRTHGSSGRPAAAPRHLTRRRFRPDIPDAKFISQSSAAPARKPVAPADRPALPPRQASEPRHKRMVALALVLIVTAAVPALVLALIFFS